MDSSIIVQVATEALELGCESRKECVVQMLCRGLPAALSFRDLLVDGLQAIEYRSTVLPPTLERIGLHVIDRN